MKAILLFVFLASASGSGAQPLDVASVLLITPRIKTRLGQDRALRSSSINVDTRVSPRTVTPTGTVFSPAQKALAGEIAEKSAAGFEVINCLSVRAQVSKSGAGVPFKYARIVAFFRLLARSQGTVENFSEPFVAFPPGDARRIAGFVSSRGVTLRSADPGENGGRPRTLSRALLERDLKRTGSSAFESFAYAGFVLAQPFVRPADYEFQETSQGVVIDVETGPRLTWKREGGRLFLRKLEYTQKTKR